MKNLVGSILRPKSEIDFDPMTVDSTPTERCNKKFNRRAKLNQVDKRLLPYAQSTIANTNAQMERRSSLKSKKHKIRGLRKLTTNISSMVNECPFLPQISEREIKGLIDSIECEVEGTNKTLENTLNQLNNPLLSLVVTECESGLKDILEKQLNEMEECVTQLYRSDIDHRESKG